MLMFKTLAVSDLNSFENVTSPDYFISIGLLNNTLNYGKQKQSKVSRHEKLSGKV